MSSLSDLYKNTYSLHQILQEEDALASLPLNNILLGSGIVPFSTRPVEQNIMRPIQIASILLAFCCETWHFPHALDPCEI